MAISLGGSDRFIPNRRSMELAQFPQNQDLSSIRKRKYTESLTEAIFPFYSEKVLHHTPAVKRFKLLQEPSLNWEFSKNPFEIVEMAGESICDFYARPFDFWQNRMVFAWNDKVLCKKLTEPQEKIQELGSIENTIYSIKVNKINNWVGIGNKAMRFHVFDFEAQKMHSPIDISSQEKPGWLRCISWRSHDNPQEVALGSDHQVVHIDLRQPSSISNMKEVSSCELACAVEWNKEANLIAVGDNQNQMKVFDIRKDEIHQPLYEVTYNAAVKALKWRPGVKNTLMVGTGTSDKGMYLLDVDQKKEICRKITSSQICSLEWVDERHIVLGTGYGAASPLSLWIYDQARSELIDRQYAKFFFNGRVLNLSLESRIREKILCAHYAEKSQAFLGFWKVKDLSFSEKEKSISEKKDAFKRGSEIR